MLGQNRTKTYIAADFDSDRDIVDLLCKWNNDNRYGLQFSNVHEMTNSRDTSLYCSIKKSLKSRMDISKTFILIVGAKTNSVTKGACHCCSDYISWVRGAYCQRSRYNVIDNRSYIKYECDMAIKAGIKIVVLYKSSIVNKYLCPDAIRDKGKHIPIYDTCKNVKYLDIKNAIMG
jgi:hypothetical protein